jgi:hypothetical protein
VEPSDVTIESIANHVKMDGIVTSVLRTGFFVDCGSLQAFVGRSMIPTEIKFDANATPPQWTDDGEQVIEKGTNIRIKIKGLRSEVDKMYAVGTMKEVRRTTARLVDYWLIKASRIISVRCRHRLTYRRPLPTRATLSAETERQRASSLIKELLQNRGQYSKDQSIAHPLCNHHRNTRRNSGLLAVSVSVGSMAIT